MQIIDGIPVFGDPDPETLQQFKEALKYGGDHFALMADHHLGYSLPVGSVVAYSGQICVNGVGYDIACGNKAIRLDVSSDDVRDRIADIMDEIQKTISFGVGRANNEKVDHDLFDHNVWNEIPLLSSLKDKAVAQLGTVGSGNHYVDVFVDECDRVWIGVHFGSRGLGHSIATYFIKQSGGKDGTYAPPILLGESSDMGEQYLRCMELAGRYAYAGRDWVCTRVAQIIGGEICEEIHNHHNFAWREKHFGRDYWVVRKGSTPAYAGQKGFVGGSMGDISVILEGTGREDSRCLYSTVHGAGRVLGRNQAKGKRDKKGNYLRVPMVTREAMLEKIRGIEVRGGDVDEAPQCYRRLEEVLKSQGDSIQVFHRLQPIGVCMASPNERDPYKE
jgi:tRNA-splicing ligase RtcB